jgi:nucleoside-diphosphate-sugar epimerase
MRVIIPGAAGEIGTQLIEELSGKHELCLIDQRPVVGHISIIADLAKRGLNLAAYDYPFSTAVLLFARAG